VKRAGIRRTEQGGMLVIVLVVIVIVSVACVATLKLTATTYRAQAILQNKSAEEDDAKNAVDTAIVLLRENASNPRAGRDVPGTFANCNSRAANFADLAGHASDAFYDEGPIRVLCKPDGGSGGESVVGGGGDGGPLLPPYVIETVGGLEGVGNGHSSGEPDNRDWIPYCDDFHATGGNVNNSCEAGVYVAPTSGPVRVGRTGTSPNVVYANSSVIVSMANALTVEGNVDARRACTGTIIASNRNCSSAPFSPSAIGCPGGDALPTAAADWTGTCDWLTPTTTQPDGSDLMTPVDLTPLYTPACRSTGYVEMPRGRYTNATQLNALMQCADTTFYFRPGTYYFDFDPALGLTRWDPPASGGTGSITSNIVGGEVPTASGAPAWLPCTATCPVQPERTLQFNYDVGSAGWTNANKGTVMNASESDGFAFFSGTTALRSLSWKQPEARIPERAGTVVKKVVLEFRHRESNPTAGAFKNDGNGNPTPNLKVTAGTSGGTCLLPIPASELSSTFRTTTFTLYDADHPADHACAASGATGQWHANMAPPVPAAINGMSVVYNAKPNTTGVEGAVDGLALKVVYEGRPAPAFPGGCDAGRSGVQFVFGGTSRMYFKGRSAYTELCGRFDPLAADPNGRYSVAILGVDEKNAPAPQRSQLAPAAEPVVTHFAPFPAGAGAVDDGLTSAAAWDGTDAATVAFRLPAADAGGIPAGSHVTGVQVRVRHRETNAASPTVTVKRDGYDAWTETLTPDPAWATRAVGAASRADDGWATGRAVFDALGDPAKLDGALVTYTVPAVSAGPKTAELDGVEITVTYRPPGTLRPLRGCLTTRSRLSPYTTKMLGADAEWAPPNANSASDATYIGNDATADAEACALVTTFSDHTPGQKFRANGMIYAPTAAFDFSGTDNEGPLFSHGLVARHLSVTRWKADPEICFGGLSCEQAVTTCADRSVTLSAYKGTTEVLRTHVRVADRGCNPVGEPEAYVDWTVLRPRRGGS